MSLVHAPSRPRASSVSTPASEVSLALANLKSRRMSAPAKMSSLGETEELIVPAGGMKPITTAFDPNSSSPLPSAKFITRDGRFGPSRPRSQLADSQATTNDGLGKTDTAHDDTNTNKATTPGQLLAWADNILAEVSATSWGKKVAEQFSLQPSSYQKMSSTEGEVGASPDALLSRLRVLEMLDSATEDAQRPPQLKIRHETEDSPTGASWEGSSHSLEVLAA